MTDGQLLRLEGPTTGAGRLVPEACSLQKLSKRIQAGKSDKRANLLVVSNLT